MRHVRMLGLALIAALSLVALFALPAAAKDPFSENTWGQYKGCPYERVEQAEPENITDCFAGITAGGSKGGYFEYGKVNVKLNQSIFLQGGFRGAGSEIEVFPATHGRETLEAPPLKVTKGLALFTKAVQKQAEWPEALIASFKEAKQNKETAVDAKIELAGTELFTVIGSLDTENILFEEGIAFKLPLKVKVTSPWLEKLGGGECLIGSDEHPIHINLTSAGAGRSGELKFSPEFTNLDLHENKLVDLGWHIEQASAPKGCGGPYEQYVDAALSQVLELGNSSRTGIVVLQGSVHDASAFSTTTEGFESGELP